ncbi:ARS binding protein 2-domain-containing protein [Coniochaeta sp. 2T2.1]|nr:ARS binding protein 2-domain-containing protein [Coniochaeta sp. 2T2.1]
MNSSIHPQGVFAPSSTTARNVAPRSPAVRQMPPDRNVTRESFEDTYVRFIFYCNPAVPQHTDTATLREAFQTPPKSGGKSFDTFLLFELIKQLESKELKTWAELALKLGVEPPDQDKGQSSQKIQQYAVRLKRWMHSMHVDAFFEYLLDRPNTYWTDIPTDQNPVNENGRDGVAAEDDMALRSLLPHIRPRRGRRKPEDDDLSKSPSQRPSMEPPPMGDELPSAHPNAMSAWSAHADARGSAFLFPVADPLRLNTGAGQNSRPPWTNLGGDTLQTPMTAYPHSAITPSTRQQFWADEPKSAITPSKARLNKRHGAKVVSSAWRSGLGGTGKTRGRPRLNRDGNQDGPFSAFPSSDLPTFKIPLPVPPLQTQNNGGSTHQIIPASGPPALTLVTSPTTIQAPSAPTTPIVNSPTPTGPQLSQNPRPAKRSRLSLQVPARVGGEVRLATPPPMVMVNGQAPTTVDHHNLQGPSTTLDHHSLHSPARPSSNCPTMKLVSPPQALPPQNFHQPNGPQQPPQEPAPRGLRFEDPSDRTNKDDLYGFFAHEVLTADWFDAAGAPIPPCGADEAWAIINTIIENLLKAANTKDAFLINLAALAGGKVLMSTTNLRMTRVEEGRERNRYRCSWELRLGDIKGAYSMEETVECKRFKKVEESEEGGAREGTESAVGREDGEGDGRAPATAEEWQRKYFAMCKAIEKKDRELAEVRLKVVQALREPRVGS